MRHGHRDFMPRSRLRLISRVRSSRDESRQEATPGFDPYPSSVRVERESLRASATLAPTASCRSLSSISDCSTCGAKCSPVGPLALALSRDLP
jgi:hypothetical protein